MVKQMAFKEENLQLLDIEKIKKFRISPGDIFWKKINGKFVKMNNLGEVLLTKDHQKFERLSGKLYINAQINYDLIFLGAEKLQKLKELKWEKDKGEARIEILDWFTTHLWNGEKTINALDLICIGHLTFYKLPEKLENSIALCAPYMMARSGIIATLGSIFALAIGYLDFNTLKDFYNALYCLDIGLVDFLTPNVFHALEKERIGGNIGKDLLSENEKNKFLKHLSLGKSILLQEYPDLINNYGIFSIIENHEEKIDGSGIGKKLFEGELSDLERLAIFLNGHFSFEDHSYLSLNNTPLIKNILNNYDEKDFYPHLGVRLKMNIRNCFTQSEAKILKEKQVA